MLVTSKGTLGGTPAKVPRDSVVALLALQYNCPPAIIKLLEKSLATPPRLLYAPYLPLARSSLRTQAPYLLQQHKLVYRDKLYALSQRRS